MRTSRDVYYKRIKEYLLPVKFIYKTECICTKLAIHINKLKNTFKNAKISYLGHYIYIFFNISIYQCPNVLTDVYK